MSLLDELNTRNTTAIQSGQPAEEGFAELPDYLVAADLHNQAGDGGFSFFDPSTWEQGLSDAKSFVATSVISGGASIYNSGVAISNFFGNDAEEIDIAAAIADIDSDLGFYYEDNKQAVDLAGFIATSLIPGTLGIKALNAAKAGYVGKTMAAATNLAVPNTEILIAKAAKELAQSQAVFSNLNAGVLKAYGAGLQAAAVESIVAEVAVTATMFRSPILENQDIGDLTANVFTGALIGGAIGGAFNAAKVFGGIKNKLTPVDDALKPIQQQSALPDSFLETDKILVALGDRDRVASATVVSDLLEEATITRVRKNTLQTLENEVGIQMQKFAGKDAELANLMTSSIKEIPTDVAQSSLFGATRMGRIATRLPEETIIAKEMKEIGLANLDDLNAPVKTPSRAIGYVSLTGENKGKVLWEAPKVTTLGDQFASANDIVRAAKNEGFSISKVWSPTKSSLKSAQLREVWVDKFAKIIPKMVIGEDDIPLLEKYYRTVLSPPQGGLELSIKNAKGQVTVLTNTQDMLAHIVNKKETLAKKLLLEEKLSVEEIAAKLNVKQSMLEGQKSAIGSKDMKDYFARQSYQESYTRDLIAKGEWKSDKGLYPIGLEPKYAKVAYDTTRLEAIDGNVLNGMVDIQQKYKLYMQGVDNAISNALGDDDLYKQLFTLSDDDILKANRFGSQASFLGFNNSNYDSLGSKTQFLGAVTARITNKFKNATSDAINPLGLQLLSKPQAAIEFATINQAVSNSGEAYILRGNALIPRRLQQYLDDIGTGKPNVVEPKFAPNTKLEIPIDNPETLEAVRTHINVNGSRYSKEKALRAAQGLEHHVDSQYTFYPIRKDYRDFKYYAFVTDEKITGTGHSSMIHANSPEALEALIAKVPPELKVITDKQSKDFFKAKGEYDHARTLNENYIDTKLKRAGVDSDYFVQTDPQKIVNTWLEQHHRQDSVLAKELVRAKNEKQFLELEKLGQQYTNVATSTKGGSSRAVEATVNNPYENYIKTALNISTANEQPLLSGFNNLMDRGFTKIVNALDSALPSVGKVDDLALINEALEKYGAKSGYYDAATNLYANASSNRGALGKFVRNANAMIATLTLRTDPFNALTNAIGSNVLLGAETQSILRAIKSGNSNAVGKLTALSKVKIPQVEAMLTSPQKLIASAYKEFITGNVDDLKAFYKANGWSSNVMEQMRSMVDDLTITGSESEVVLASKTQAAFAKFKSLADKAEVATGNRLAEDMNRFVAASVAKKFTDAAEEAGIFNPSDSLAMINTFVNRTQGNMLASQRPLMFQGAVGNALGLFQTYQVNLMQQLFRYVGEGSAKDAAMLLGLQGTIFGMNGLPAFNFMNTHIIGNASGNTQHKDLYDATYGVAGKELGDFLMFGAASNMPKIANILPFVDGVSGVNLYTRGDLNPRHLTIVPINPVDFPLTNAISKLYTNTTQLMSNIVGGANAVESITQALEHNGFSRPLAGLAQVSQAFSSPNGQVYTTDSKSNMLASNDLFSVSSLIRLSGGKPLDEAVISDRFFTSKAYEAKDRARMDALRERIKTSVIQGNTLGENEYAEFAYQYAKIGGKTKNFNKFVMNQFTNANTPAAQRIAGELANPMAQKMQEVMQGRQLTSPYPIEDTTTE